MIPLESFSKFWPTVFPLVFLIGLFLSTVVQAADIHYDAGGRRDPFVPLIEKGGTMAQGFNPSGLNVEGIIHDPSGGSLVLINGDYYKEGQTVNKATIISIFKDRVILAQGDDEKTLWLREEIIAAKTAGQETSSRAKSK